MREGVPDEVRLKDPISVFDRILAQPRLLRRKLHSQEFYLLDKDTEEITYLLRTMRSYLLHFSRHIGSNQECKAIHIEEGSESFLLSYEFSRYRSDAAHLDIHNSGSQRIANIYVANGEVYEGFVMLPSVPFTVTRNAVGQIVPSNSRYLDSNFSPWGDLDPAMAMLSNFRTHHQSKLSFDYFTVDQAISFVLTLQ